ncbi:FAD-binding oxidoreductase [Cellulomonas denverensis]|uniref:FAD-binding protein n=1 Tax=Cellulomonas denverensis TaxID=264297 RepID=A0A7X6QXL5_9CELL|nr:FAD-linked oxidase C-terminal domain-containing protein [Cellulomonas denverensis]NKY21056.1 FAD-binding protein [Cellulomonas denverensis]GIG26003.1 FAD-linked oxidase [Cellulomonas denverensis]
MTAVTTVAGLDALAPTDRSAEGRERARSDRSGWSPDGLPDAVVRPDSVDQVQQVVRWAAAHRVPLVPRGAGTGLTGGAAAAPGQVVLDLSGLDAIESLDPGARTAVVQPGVILADLDRAAAAHGLRYVPDPGSVAIASIGGTIATNAGGLRCARHGGTREAVAGLDVVLADGSLLRTGTSGARSVTGYDLTSLFVGSEGTLGVVVRATVRLQPLPVATATVTALFPDVATAAHAVATVLAAGPVPPTLELLDHATLAAVDPALADRGGAFLLVQTEGAPALAEATALAGLLRGTALEVDVTDDPVRAERLLATRRDALPAVQRHGRVLIEDVSVPPAALAEAITGIEAIADRTGVRVFTFAHAGAGVIHPLVLTDDGEITPRVRETVDAIVALALRLGGTLTGEHGIGALKRHWLPDELDPVARTTLHRIKAALDPAGVLNPGKAI